MKLLVTGGAGFIGSHFIKHIIREHPDYRIICMDALTYAGNLRNLDGVIEDTQFQFRNNRIEDAAAVNTVFASEHFDAVVNFAAESHVDNSIASADIFIKTNVQGALTLLNACQKYSVHRFHQISTDEVYGDLPLDRMDLFFHEDSLLNPSSPYSASKASADLLVNAFHRTYGLYTTISRCSNNYGPNQHPEKLIPLMCIRAMKGEKLPVYGDGQNVRDWIFVEDHCLAVDRILSSGRSGEIYNIGGNEQRSNLSVVLELLSALGKTSEQIEFVANRPGHDRRYAVDFSKLHRELGWAPKHGFSKGLRETIHWYAANEAWWAPLLSTGMGHDNKQSGE